MALPRDFFARPAIDVARELLGAVLVMGEVRVRLVETEAYVGPQDLACHASKGRTRRTDVLWGPPGHVYVYLIYGMYHCLNVVTEPEGFPAAVLVRAAEPLTHPGVKLDGPGKLCRELGISLAHNRLDLCDPACPLQLEPAEAAPRIARGPRVGVDYAGSWARKPYRYMISGSPFGSKPRLPLKVRGPA